PARFRHDAERVALVVAQPAGAARPHAGRGHQDAPDERDPAERRPRPERGLRPREQGVRLLHPGCGGAGAHAHRSARQLRPRLRRRGGQGQPHQVPPGAAEPVPHDRLSAGASSPPPLIDARVRSRYRLGREGTMTHLQRLSAAVVATVALVSTWPVVPAGAFPATESVDARLRLDWQAGTSRGGRPFIAGYVYNDYVRSAGDVRLLVEAIDAAGVRI